MVPLVIFLWKERWQSVRINNHPSIDTEKLMERVYNNYVLD
ncbi:hypothetical protein Pmgp_01069 [Pelotomaculum propionicicum]|uniref:Uncharacterized protein n=1 Tax=Pelotomaculum propionicicum TaxID=258475 RepID=A0A4Y7RTX1_9FIRM|nr:hypothetical protein Pmgp_01069 [Pelotomaculum propionicicum]